MMMFDDYRNSGEYYREEYRRRCEEQQRRHDERLRAYGAACEQWQRTTDPQEQALLKTIMLQNM